MGLLSSGAPHPFDNVAVWDAVDSLCVLGQPVEQRPPVAGGTAIEVEGVFIEVVVEVFVADCPPKWMSIPGVVGTAIGEYKGKSRIKVLVVRKTEDLTKKIPAKIGGFPVVIQETGEIRALEKD